MSTGTHETRIVNIRTTPDEAIDEYIDRRSDFGNPFKLEEDGGEYTRKESVEAYREYFHAESNADLRERAREELAGKTLGCWCKPKACHGDVIKAFLDGESQ